MRVYKILRPDEWERLAHDGESPGAPVDVADGYIHLSTAAQVAETVSRHFAGEADLRLMALESETLGPELRWETSRGGDLFPHLYRPLRLRDAVWVRSLPSRDGGHVFPGDLS